MEEVHSELQDTNTGAASAPGDSFAVVEAQIKAALEREDCKKLIGSAKRADGKEVSALKIAQAVIQGLRGGSFEFGEIKWGKLDPGVYAKVEGTISRMRFNWQGQYYSGVNIVFSSEMWNDPNLQGIARAANVLHEVGHVIDALSPSWNGTDRTRIRKDGGNSMQSVLNSLHVYQECFPGMNP
jgi:hypothetical protein